MINMIYLRGGYLLAMDKNLNQYSIGLGIKYRFTTTLTTRLDYAIVPLEDLGYTHFVTIGLMF